MPTSPEPFRGGDRDINIKTHHLLLVIPFCSIKAVNSWKITKYRTVEIQRSNFPFSYTAIAIVLLLMAKVKTVVVVVT